MACRVSQRFKNDIVNEWVPNLLVLLAIIGVMLLIMGIFAVAGWFQLHYGWVLDIKANSPWEYYLGSGALSLVLLFVIGGVIVASGYMVYGAWLLIKNAKRMFKYVIECDED